MIYIVDDFLPDNLLTDLYNYIDEFTEVKTPGKSFWIKKLPEDFINYMVKRLEKIEGKKIKNILSFVREANENQDDEWRIHNDTVIENQQPDRAVVFYLKSNESELNGTALWEHKKYGDQYNNNSIEEFNRLLIEDANDESKWNLKTIIGSKDNRLLSYPCNYFHSKYPNKFNKQRIVLVMFYKYERK